jgi:hypothetical protein
MPAGKYSAKDNKVQATAKLLQAMQVMTEVNAASPGSLTEVAPRLEAAAEEAGLDPAQERARLAARFVAKASNAVNGSVTYTSALTMYYILYNTDHEISHNTKPFNVQLAVHRLQEMASTAPTATTEDTQPRPGPTTRWPWRLSCSAKQSTKRSHKRCDRQAKVHETCCAPRTPNGILLQL